MSGILGFVVVFAIATIVAAIVIFIVSKLGLGLEVDSFGDAIIAAIVIGIVSSAVHWFTDGIITGGTNWLAVIINIIVAAVILMISDKLLKGMRVSGFVGAIIAAIGISAVSGILSWAVGLVL